MQMKSFIQLKREIITCTRCPRLRTHCTKVARIKRASYKNQVYWGKPVPGFGDLKARLWIVGLAPGAHGANRTGRVFTGDSSGDWLYSALYRFGLSSSPSSMHLKDGLTLSNTYISCVCRCAPPANRPSPREIATCAPFLTQEWGLLGFPPLILALGQIAFEQIIKLLTHHYQMNRSTDWKFRHGATYWVGKTQVLVSYHPSQQNTSTKRLTTAMWDSIFETVTRELKNHSFGKN